MSPTPRILQVDADAFFVQVARLEDPAGAGRAALLLVGGSPSGRGVVTSASYEARKFGARSGMPTAQALRLCPDAMVVGVPRRACAAKSREIVQVLGHFTPVVEPASIDEMYLDLSGTEALYKGEPLAVTARRIRDAVRDEAAIAVSIGGGTNRLVAKLAAGRAKPHRTPEAGGVIVVPPGSEGSFLEGFTLDEIPGVGPRFQEHLATLGLRTVRDALRHSESALRRWLGDRAGRWLARRVRGLDDTPVEPRLHNKSISRDETFATDFADDGPLLRELLRLVDRATADLRANGYAARTVSVRIRDHDFRNRQKSRTLPEPVISDRVVAGVAKELLDALRGARRVPARLLGVSLSSLVHEGAADQLSLFRQETAPIETERDRKLARALDAVRRKYGTEAVGRGLSGPEPRTRAGTRRDGR